jgi:hypothetical protein
MGTQTMLTRSLLVGLFLATVLASPAHASKEDIARELERMGLPAETLSVTSPRQVQPARSALPELSATLTLAAPLSAIGFSATFGYAGIPLALFIAPPTIGAGHFLAGDPWRGTLVGLGAPAMMLGSYMVFGSLGATFDTSGPHQARGIGIGLLGSLVATTGYWLWAAFDAAETARRKQDEATRQAPVAPR